jgi:hypothetical protein
MTTALITFPLRLGLRGARLVAGGLGDLAEWSAGLIGVAGELVRSRDQDTRDHDRPPRPPAPPSASSPPPASPPPASPPVRKRRTPEPRQTPEPRRTPERRVPPPGPAAAARPEPIPEEPVIVRESADPGAEDGAGAQVRVAEPWSGYDQLGARDVIERLAAATPAELAAVELYEGSKRRRKTVLAAAERRLAET